MSVALFCDYLETYAGRDKVLRTLSYAAKFATAYTSNKETEAKFKIFSSQLSGCRVILRLLDDLPTLHYAFSYGLGAKEPDWVIRWVELLQIGVDLIFNPIEHICWAGEHKLININTAAWDNATTWFWILSLQLSLMKSLRKIKELDNYKRHLLQTQYYSTKKTPSRLDKQRWNELLTCTRLALDISYAVSYLPPGIFWGGQLKTWQVGALGTMSSLIGLYQALSKKAEQKDK